MLDRPLSRSVGDAGNPEDMVLARQLARLSGILSTAHVIS
jgi:hypothetical protein